MELTQELQQKEKTAQMLWTGFILAFFVIQAVIWAFAITFTMNDKSHAIVSDYDEKALNWDEEVAERLASSKLGWNAEILVDPTSDVSQFHAISIKLIDSEGQPVTKAKLELGAFHRSRAANTQKIQMSEINDGIYSGKIQIRRSGS